MVFSSVQHKTAALAVQGFMQNMVLALVKTSGALAEANATKILPLQILLLAEELLLFPGRLTLTASYNNDHLFPI